MTSYDPVLPGFYPSTEIPVRVPAPEQARLSRQCADILARLRQGPASNKELAALSLKYTSLISDLRHAGYDVQIVSRDRVSGLTIYRVAS